MKAETLEGEVARLTKQNERLKQSMRALRERNRKLQQQMNNLVVLHNIALSSALRLSDKGDDIDAT